ncbi:MAG: hypothetical protein ACI9MX_001732 [Candidatus Aldehydirespiratoraceae bacterium]|jgi:hypothetical protein
MDVPRDDRPCGVYRLRPEIQGNGRTAWVLVALSFFVTILLFTIDPKDSGSDLTLALHFAVITSVGFWAAVIALSAPALPGMTSLRTAADALWVTCALVVALWPWVIDPLLHTVGPSEIQRVLRVAFAISTIALSTTILVVISHTAGRGRVARWFLGIGGATTSAAGVFHIRFFYEGTLRFGSVWDYPGTVGTTALVIGSLTSFENELVPRQRPVSWHAFITVLPLGLAATATTSWATRSSRLWLAVCEMPFVTVTSLSATAATSSSQ